jgi:Mrp family chromosome partitioning ATPase
MSRLFAALGKGSVEALTPQTATEAPSAADARPGDYSELVRRLFNRPSAIAVTASGVHGVQTGVCEGIAAELAAAGKQVVVVPVDRLLLTNPIRVIDDLSVLPVVSPNIWVWPSIAQQFEVFDQPPAPSGENWLARLRQSFHAILLDCPPIDSMPGVLELSAMADATLLVVEAGRTTRQQIRKDQLALQSKGATLAGCILVQGR